MDKSLFPQIIGVASGKGGAGKTTVSINMAVALVLRGHKVMLLDADLGMANAQIALGAHAAFNISHVLSGEKTLEEVLVTTKQGIRLVPGSSGLRDIAALDSQQIAHMIHAFDALQEPVDYLIVDVAAGIAPAVLSFMAACQRRFVVVCDQPSSIADAYGLIKVMATEQSLDEIYLIPNMVGSAHEGRQLHRRLNDVCTRFLGISLKPLPGIEADELVLQSLRKYQSVLEFAPGSAAARDFRALADAIDHLPAIDGASGRVQFFAQRMLRSPFQG
ncbi:MinD/ParA family protein [Limnohabitans sp.]|jgi:flagellar biosynthesis protein FlhG|uniref:MinD/ParA family protein n=1 Tax=Limnohabitans sp. TaxID=1907725 RepID=UPI0037BFA040